MKKIPENLLTDELSEYLSVCRLRFLSQGKVRDTWQLEKNRLLVVATDRISIFDFVLNALIPKKGEVLNALTHFWSRTLGKEFSTHLISSKNFPAFNAVLDLWKDFPGLPLTRCLVVKNLSGRLYPFEMIYRHHIGGSVFKDYQKTGKAGGHELPPNLPKWSKLEKPIFTPSTKEDVGHDVNVDAAYFFQEMGKMGLSQEAYLVDGLLTRAYMTAYALAEKRGILILDTKFEVAGPIIVDEILTPDSSRFALKSDWELAMKEGRDPYFHDKQPVRDWGAKIPTPFVDGEGRPLIGLNKLDPKNPEHVEFVHGLEVPQEIIESTTERYLGIFEKLTGQELLAYQGDKMGAI